MKKLMVSIWLLMALVLVPSAKAETVRTCSSVYGGGEVCGESTTTVVVEHEPVEAGILDSQLLGAFVVLGAMGVVATFLYKFSYRWYIFD